MACSAQIHVHTGWRKVDPTTGLASATLAEFSNPDSEYDIPFFDLTPTAQAVDVTDVGGGLVSVSFLGSYIQGLRFLIGTTTLDQSSPNFWFNGQRIAFFSPVKDISLIELVV